MAIFKCKTCGNAMKITGEMTVCECEYCATKQPVPGNNKNAPVPEALRRQLNRANYMRLRCEFDKAEQLYSKLTKKIPDEPEAHWGLLLSKYGIQYVEDTDSLDYIPACHRPSTKAFTEADEYKVTVRCADAAQRELYEAEAKAIEKVRQNIIAAAEKEKACDVFICCNNDDKAGNEAAKKLYDKLTKSGKAVYYAPVSIRDNTASSKEACIYSALCSAKVMLILGTEPEYFYDVWTRNEWSRFLKLAGDGSRTLIPCCMNMDVHEMPEELIRLNFRDMSRENFVDKLVHELTSSTAQVNTESKKEQSEGKKEPKEDHKDVIAGDIGSGFVQDEPDVLHTAEKAEEPVNDEKSDNSRVIFPKASLIIDGSKEQSSEPLKPAYIEAMKIINSCASEGQDLVEERENVVRAKELLETIPEYKDSSELINACSERIKEIDYQRAVSGFGMGNRNEAWLIKNRNAFISLGDYKESAEYARMCDDRIKSIKYNDAFKLYDLSDKNIRLNQHLTEDLLKKSIDDLEAAKVLFKSVEGYKESKEYLKKIEVLLEDATESYKTITTASMLKKGKTAKRRRIIAIICASLIGAAVLAVGSVSLIFYIIPESKYNNAVSLQENGKYEEAAADFGELGDYRDSQERKSNSLASLAFEGMSAQEKAAMLVKGRTLASGQIYSEIQLIVGVKENGTVTVFGAKEGGMSDISSWNNIDAVSVRMRHIMGLRADGTVAAAGNNDYGQCEVSGWTGIAAVSAGNYHTVALASNGIVYTAGNNAYGQCNTEKWENIAAIAAGDDFTVGLKKDGTVLVTRIINTDETEQYDTSGWTNIVGIAVGDDHIVGLRSDGTVCAAGSNNANQCNVTKWTGITAISAGSSHTVGLRADGTVVAAGNNFSGKCNVEDWNDIVAVSAGNDYTLGVRSDGTVVIAGSNDSAQKEISSWKLKTN